MSTGETLVIALGGNALLKRGDKGTFEEQFANVVLASKEIVGLIEKDYRVVLTHGNGPQVGATLIRHDLAKNVVPPFPLHACNAETQGFIGYMIQQALQNELNRRNMAKSVVSVVTRILVDRNDPSFQNPTKPIGPYFEKSQYPNLLNIFEGYKQGAKHINPDIKVIETYLGDWDSPEKGRQAALVQIFSGADFILHVADTSGKGVIQAAKENEIYAFGAVSDQHHIAPEAVLTSFVLDIDKAFDQIVRTVVENRFEGKIYKPGLEASKGAPGEGIVYLAPFHNLEGRVPEDVKQRLNQLTQDIINKAIVVPEKYEVTTDFPQKSPTAATIAKTEPKILKIALVTDGLFSDGGWGAAAYNAAKQLETNYGHNLTYVDNIAISDIENTLRQYSEDGYDLIIAHGFQWGDPAVRVGIEYPNTKYVVFTGLVASNNVASIFPMQQEATFLLGALAAMMSRTGTIGYVGGDKLDNFLTSVQNKIVWKYQGDAKYRRVVPSPKPVAILEYPVIRSLANSGYIVIACGGGGIPVIAGGDDDEKVVGIDAVIDKDLAGELLARQIGAQKFIILTDVKGLYIDYRKPTQRLVSEVFANKNDDNFTNILRLEEGSMGPKVHACLQFVKNGGKEAVIASLDNVVDAISGRAGTHFYP
ncbi:MAG TPA: BMP family ABC transporter substrate-binding protein [Nitrososphaeraceae archaeon]|nr:BMP family ABC transporter substrate-binding protein [Nitrososphaeraceae archaeon]